VHSYYHLLPLICCYCSVGYLSDSVDYSNSSQLECFTIVGVFPCISSADGGSIWLYSQMWYPGLNPSVKLHALDRSVVPAGVIILLEYCNPPR
jgi:hypothetical protein